MPPPLSRRPALSLSGFQQELDRLFRQALGLADAGPAAGRWRPAVDVVETADSVQVLVEVPGIQAADLEVTVDGQVLRISGRKAAPECRGDARFHCVERDHGSFEREVELRGPVNTREATARLTTGLLTVGLPKTVEKRVRRRIPVSEGAGG